MSHQPLDDGGLARQALSSAVASHGISVLSDPKALGDAAARLLPGSPRERSLLVAAADAGVASLLRRHLQQQHVDPATAVQLAARELAERTALEASACTWVTAEFARALGYPEGQAATQSPAPSAPSWGVPQQPGAGYPPTQVAYGAAGAAPPGAPAPPGFQPPGGPPPGFQPPGGPPPGFQAPGGQAPGFQAPGGQAPGGQAPGWWQAPPGQVPPWPGPPAPARSPRRPGWPKSVAVVAAAVAVAALAGYVATAAAAHLFPFARTTASPAPVAHGAAHPSPRPSSAAAPPAGVAGLVQLLPGVLDDPQSQCSALNPPYHWSMSGIVQALQCLQVPGLPNGAVYAFQLDNASDYATAWLNYNQWWGFNGSDAGTTCPPPDVSGEGTEGYDNHFFPQTNGQVLECGEASGHRPAYTWTMPTEYTFIVAQAAPGTSFATLDSWWTENAVPAAAPTPPPP